MISMVILMRILFALYVSNQVGPQFGHLTQTVGYFAEELDAMGFKDENNRFADHLKQNTGLTLLWNTLEPHAELPDISVYKAWHKSLQKASNQRITMSYQELPEKTIWLHHHAAPQFSLGIPEIYRKAITEMLIVYLVIAVLFSLISAFIASRFLNRALKKLSTKVRLIGQDINIADIDSGGPKEIRDVSLAITQMQQDIDAMINKQTVLLTSISHDLRTPLTRVHMATKIMQHEDTELINSIYEDIVEMNDVLHRFIELARFNIEETEHWQIGNLQLYITDIVNKFNNYNVKISLYFGALPLTRYKPMALKSYLYNLLNNSIKHGGGNITISSERIDDKIQLIVSDEGPGFPLSTEELSSYSDLNLEHNELNGLGLRIVQLIAKLHEAELILRNKPEGGAEVVLILSTYIGLTEEN